MLPFSHVVAQCCNAVHTQEPGLPAAVLCDPRAEVKDSQPVGQFNIDTAPFCLCRYFTSCILILLQLFECLPVKTVYTNS